METATILNFLNDDKNWTKDLVNKDLWSYCEISETLKVGRQKFDWAIFKRNKNLEFYFAKTYREVPGELLTDLNELIKEVKNEKINITI